MDKINNGGPAFPHPGGAYDSTVQESHLGLSLRDWFAGQALATILDVARQDQRTISFQDHAAGLAYQVADAMLKAREAQS